jgi:hypothetical protein
MEIIIQLITFYEKVRQEINKDPGSIYSYFVEEDRGLLVAAEFMARVRRKGMGVFFIPTSSVGNLLILPTPRCQNTFLIDSKLDRIYTENHYLICVQIEAEMDTGNYLVLRISENASAVELFAIYKNKPMPFKIADIILNFDNNIKEDFSRMLGILSSELELMQMKVSPTGFGIL